MGMLALKRIMAARRERRHQRVQSRNGFIANMPKRKDSLCQDDNSQDGKRLRYSGPDLPDLPKEIWCHIHSLMPLRDAARAACVSHAFLRSWRRYPNLILTKKTLGFKGNACVKGDIATAFTSIIDEILKNHSGIGVKTLKLNIFDCHDLDSCYLNNWLQIAITPGIEKLTVFLPIKSKKGYNFPCSHLFGGSGSSLRYLHVNFCAFRPTVGLGGLRSLTKLHLLDVRITGEELGCVLSNSFALKQLDLRLCCEIICLKIPCGLERLSSLSVSSCDMLQMIESKAPNLSTFNFNGDLVQLSLGQSLQLKSLFMECINEFSFLCYAITKLPYIMPNLKNLALSSFGEMVDTPMVAAKFMHLKYLEIYLCGDLSPEYDYLSLLSFLDASPVLKTFILGLRQRDMRFDSVFGGASHMRQMPAHKHNSLKNVMVLGFCSAKSMVELTCHILENAKSLECITVDTVFDVEVFDVEDEDHIRRCSVTSARRTSKCCALSNRMILEANKALMAIERYIVGKVPSSAKLNIGRPCSRCHILKH